MCSYTNIEINGNKYREDYKNNTYYLYDRYNKTIAIIADNKCLFIGGNKTDAEKWFNSLGF